MKPSGKSAITSKRLGVLIGGSGLIGGALTHFYKKTSQDTEVLAPSSKKLSLRVLDDIKQYCRDLPLLLSTVVRKWHLKPIIWAASIWPK